MQHPASPPSAARRYAAPPRTGNVTGFAIALALHAAALTLLLQYAPARQALADAVPLMVSLITPPETKPDVPPKPVPVKRMPQPRITPPQPVLTTTTEAPSPVSIAPQPEPAPAPIAAAPAPPVAAAPPPPAIPPNFSADYLNNPAPAYPAVSRRLGEQGRVVLRVRVEPNGLPSDVRLHVSSGFDRLDNVALATVRRWKFVPARRGDEAVGAWVLVPLSFSLRS